MLPGQSRRKSQKNGIMSTIDELISSFESISLEKMDEVKLLNRMDAKFAFRAEKLPGILAQLSSSYFILEIDQLRLQRYETLYFDTPGHTLYLNHHNKRLHRFKVRSRKYVDSGLCYFEIKFKNNKRRTIKHRNRQTGRQEEITGKQEHIPGNNISKYCLGMISLNEKIKQNNFKQKLHIIKKLNHDIC